MTEIELQKVIIEINTLMMDEEELDMNGLSKEFNLGLLLLKKILIRRNE